MKASAFRRWPVAGAYSPEQTTRLTGGSDYEGILLPVEVKLADNTKAKSLQLFCKCYHPKMAIKTSLKNVGDNQEGETHIWSIPLYTLFRLKEYLYKEMNW